MVLRKLFSEKEPKVRKQRVQKISAKKLDVDALTDAVIDGKLCIEPGAKCLVSRWGRELHNCTYIRLDEKHNVVELWDDTVSHMYSVSLNETLPETFKVIQAPQAKKNHSSQQQTPEQVIENALEEPAIVDEPQLQSVPEETDAVVPLLAEEDGAVLSDAVIEDNSSSLEEEA